MQNQDSRQPQAQRQTGLTPEGQRLRDNMGLALDRIIQSPESIARIAQLIHTSTPHGSMATMPTPEVTEHVVQQMKAILETEMATIEMGQLDLGRQPQPGSWVAQVSSPLSQDNNVQGPNL